jgi:hypothetical protein
MDRLVLSVKEKFQCIRLLLLEKLPGEKVFVIGFVGLIQLTFLKVKLTSVSLVGKDPKRVLI